MSKYWRLPAWESIIIISLICHLLAAVFSSGFHHFDEHFQIYEFLNFKLGKTSSDALAWEYREQIRPWFQVWVYFCFHQIQSFFGVSSPFTHAFYFRLWTSLAGWFSLIALWPLIQQWIKKERWQIYCFGLLHLAWYVPYIQARTSSESFGIIFLFLGLNYFLVQKYGRLSAIQGLIAGLFFGLAYLSRFQMALMVAPIWFWAILFKQVPLKRIWQTACGVLLAIALGFVFDFWGYGVWTFSLWHYFRTNFLGGIMSSVQQYPFYWYLRWSLLRGIPPLALPLIAATLWGWIKWPRHALFWITLPIFFFHSLVGHKELRYIFPVILLSPIYLFLCIEWLELKYSKLFQNKWLIKGISLLLVLNFIFLLVATFRPANPAVNFYRFLYSKPEIKRLVALDEDPFTMLGLPISFYKPDTLEVFVTKPENLRWQGEIYLFTRSGEDLILWSKNDKCQQLYTAYPVWALQYNWGNWIGRSRVWSLFKCQKP